MWRDILIVVTLVLAVLSYLGLTPKRLSIYVKKISVPDKIQFYIRVIYFLLVISMTVYFPILMWQRYGEWSKDMLATGFYAASLITLAWFIFIRVSQPLSERARRILLRVVYLVFVALIIASWVFVDMHLWQKIVIPIGSFSIGFALRILTDYIGDKIEQRRALKD